MNEIERVVIFLYRGCGGQEAHINLLLKRFNNQSLYSSCTCSG